MKAGDPDAALAAFVAALQESPGDYGALHGRAVALQKKGAFSESIESFRHLSQLDPQQAEGLIGWGQTALQCGRAREAADVFQRAIAEFADNSAGYFGLARTWLSARRFAEADSVALRARKRFPRRATQVDVLRIRVAQARGQLDLVESIAEALRNQSPYVPEAWTALAGLFHRRGEHQKAETLMNEAIAVCSSSPAVRWQLAVALSHQGKAEQALALYPEGTQLLQRMRLFAFLRRFSEATDVGVALVRQGNMPSRGWSVWFSAALAAGRLAEIASTAEAELRRLADGGKSEPLAEPYLRALYDARLWDQLKVGLDATTYSTNPVVEAYRTLSQAQDEGTSVDLPALVRRREDCRHHVLITGTGRSGTTALVELLTALGLDTGFEAGHAHGLLHPNCRAGLEFDVLMDPSCPHIVKSPEAADRIDEILARPDLVLDALIIPVRDLDAVVESRKRAEAAYGSAIPSGAPGGIVGSQPVEMLGAFLARRVMPALSRAAEFEIPVVIPAFPRMLRDASYLYRVLKPVLGNSIANEERFAHLFASVVDR